MKTRHLFQPASILLLLPIAATAQTALPDGLQKPFREALHRVRARNAGFEFNNPENRFQTRFSRGGILARHSEGTFRLRLAAYGYGHHPPAPAAAEPHAEGARLEYRRGPLTEWYI